MRNAFRRGPDFFAAVAKKVQLLLENDGTIDFAGNRWAVVLESRAQATITAIRMKAGIRPPKPKRTTPAKSA